MLVRYFFDIIRDHSIIILLSTSNSSKSSFIFIPAFNYSRALNLVLLELIDSYFNYYPSKNCLPGEQVNHYFMAYYSNSASIQVFLSLMSHLWESNY